MGVIVDPEFDKSMHEMVPVMKGILDEIIEYFDDGEFAKAFACMYLVHEGITPMANALLDYFPLNEYDNLVSSGWEPKSRIKWKEENQELWAEIESNRNQQEQRRDAIRALILRLGGHNHG